VATCAACRMNVEVYQDQTNATYGTKCKMLVAHYSTLMAVPYSRSVKDTALNSLVIPAKKLEELAAK